MKTTIKISLIALFTAFAFSCGNTGKKEKDGALNDKKVQLEKLKKDTPALILNKNQNLFL